MSAGLFVQRASADDDPNVPVAIEKATGRSGEFQIKVSDRSPLSRPADVSKRSSLKSAAGEADYDLTKETFQVYVPKSPAADGKYGLVDLLPFPAHARPPRGWDAVLEKYHLIWIADPAGGDGRPPLQRMGLMLDAAYNVQKKWPVDDRRVYDLTTSAKSPAAGVGLYYPDVFQGTIFTADLPWWSKISDSRWHVRLNTDKLAHPEPEQYSLDRTRSRWVCVMRDIPLPPNAIDPEEVIFKQGWSQAGFSHLKRIMVPYDQMHLFSTYSPEWFDSAVAFLDESMSVPQTASEKQPAGHASPQPATEDKAAAPDPAQEASRALSLAKSYIAAQRYDAARTRLNRIVQTYPGTPAATEAKSLLQQIQDK